MGIDAEQDLVPFVVLRVEVMGVARGDQGNARVFSDANQSLVHHGLFGKGVGHDLKEVVSLPHDVLVEQRPFGGLILPALQDQLGHLPRQTGGGGDDPPGAAGQKVVIDARLVVEAVRVGDGDELDEVAIPFFVLGEEDEVVVLPLLFP